MWRSLNEALAQLVANKTISAKDAMRAAYNRAELYEMLSAVRVVYTGTQAVVVAARRRGLTP